MVLFKVSSSLGRDWTLKARSSSSQLGEIRTRVSISPVFIIVGVSGTMRRDIKKCVDPCDTGDLVGSGRKSGGFLNTHREVVSERMIIGQDVGIS